MTAAENLHTLFAEAWAFTLEADPLNASQLGEKAYDHLLPVVSEAEFARQLTQVRAFEERLQAIPRADLSPEDQLNYDLFAEEMEKWAGEIVFHSYRLPISKTGGFHIYLPELPGSALSFDGLADYEHYLQRLAAFRDYVAGMIEVMQVGLDAGQIPPQITLEGVAGQIEAQIVSDPSQSRFYTPFTQFPTGIDGHTQASLQAQAQTMIAEAVVPGFKHLLDFFNAQYYPAARPEVGASHLPDGLAFYQQRIRTWTSLDLSPQAIHATGLAEVDRILGEMEETIRESGFAGDRHAYVEFLRSDPQFYAKSAPELLQRVAYVLKKMDGELPRLFKTLPRTPYGIREIDPISAPYNTTAYYYPPSADGKRAGFYWVNTYDLPSRPLYEIEALSLHEAVPGHHLQLALQMELGDVPAFRKYGWSAAYGEGWALYAERLGLEVGFYQDPASNFGRLSYEMWRACRLVVDTGLHALGWTRQRAIDYMAEHTSLTLLNIQNEVDRYIAWPGQALAYKLGEIKIRQLRGRAEAALGARFDLREFHDAVLLSGGISLRALERRIEDWIKAAVQD